MINPQTDTDVLATVFDGERIFLMTAYLDPDGTWRHLTGEPRPSDQHVLGTQPLPWSAELVTVGGIYHHKSDHTRGYQVLHITNTGQFSDKFPPQVVYQHPLGSHSSVHWSINNMKTLILVLALTLAPVTASAIPCGGIANLAGTIMKVRQQGIPIHTIMDKLESNFTGDPKLLEVVQMVPFRKFAAELGAKFCILSWPATMRNCWPIPEMGPRFYSTDGRGVAAAWMQNTVDTSQPDPSKAIGNCLNCERKVCPKNSMTGHLSPREDRPLYGWCHAVKNGPAGWFCNAYTVNGKRHFSRHFKA